MDWCRRGRSFPAAFALGFLLLCAAAGSATADEGLYGPAAPPGSAFVRVFNNTPHDLRDVRVGEKGLPEIQPFGASEFVFLPPGSVTLTAGAAKQPLSLAKDTYHTAVVGGGEGVRVIDNGRWSSRLKSLVILYNLLDGGPVDLRTADGKPVVDAVAPGAAAQREVNAVRVNLALFRDGKKVADVRPVNLERGKSFSLFVTGSDAQPLPVWVVY